MSSSGPRRSKSLGFLVLAGALVSSASAAEQRASLVLVDSSPVVVAGRGFFPRERVTLRTAIAGQQITRTVKADRDGRFTAQLADLDAECLPFTISAAGQRGSRAMTRRMNIQPCGVQIQP